MSQFEHLDTENGLQALNRHLQDYSYVDGYTPSKSDAEHFPKVSDSVDATHHPHVARWHKHVASYSTDERAAWSAVPAVKKVEHGHPHKHAHDHAHDQAHDHAHDHAHDQAHDHAHDQAHDHAHDHAHGGHEAHHDAHAEPKKEQEKKDDKKADDDFDLFDDKADEEHEKLIEKIKAEHEAKKAAAGKVVVGKSSVILEVKPWDDETDLKKMEEGVRAIQMDGLTWGASKLVPIAFGLRKLQIVCTVIDDQCSVDELCEKIQDLQDLVQSVDIAAFNKL